MIRSLALMAAVPLAGCVVVNVPPSSAPTTPPVARQAHPINPCGLINCNRPDTRRIV